MKILKCSIPLLVAAVLIVLSFPISASAESDLVPDTYVDLLQSATYSVSLNGGEYQQISRPFYYLSYYKYASFKWDASGDDIKFHDYYFTIQATGKPSYVTVSLNPSHSVTATYIASNGPDLHQYRFTSANSNIEEITLTANWSYSYIGNFAVLSFTGLRDYSQDVTNANFRFRISRYSNGALDYPILDYGYRSFSEGIGCYHYGTYPNQELFSGQLFVWLPQKALNFAYADSVSFLISTMSPIINSSVSLVDTSTTVKSVLSHELIFSCSASVGGYTLGREVYFYQVNADLRGYDLRNLMIQLFVEVDSVFGPNSTDQQMVNVWCTAASVVPPNAEVPWYLRMYNWLDSSISMNTDRIVDAIGSLGGAFNDPDSMQDVQDINSSVANKQNQANSINDKMNSVAKPKPSDVTTGTPDISGILSGSSAPLVMSTITGGGNGIFVTVLLLVFTFALVGFIFFGKR